MTLREAIEEYLIDQVIRGNSGKTVIAYRYALSYFLNFATDLPIEEVTLSLCRSYYIALHTRSLSTVTVMVRSSPGLRAEKRDCSPKRRPAPAVRSSSTMVAR